MMEGSHRVLLSRPDALGDAVVTLTTAGWLAHHRPDAEIMVLIRRYTEPVWRHSEHVGRIVVLEDLQALGPMGAVQALRDLHADALVHVFPQREVAHWGSNAGIPRRIGTSHRWWHWTTCNERVHFSRARSGLHEALLNIKLLGPLGVPMPRDITELVPHIGFRVPPPGEAALRWLRPDRTNVVIHPCVGSGVGWGFANHATLIRALDPGRFHCIITGTAEEAKRYREALPLDLAHVSDAGGALALEELIELIGASQALVAASTGPLHLAAACGIRAIGLFSMRRPIFPARWAPIGRDAHALVFDPACARCAKGGPCDCITRIAPERVLALLRDR